MLHFSLHFLLPTNLRSHLQKQHPEEYAALRKIEESAKKAISSRTKTIIGIACVTLTARRIESSHTGVYVRMVVDNVLAEWDVQPSKVQL